MVDCVSDSDGKAGVVSMSVSADVVLVSVVLASVDDSEVMVLLVTAHSTSLSLKIVKASGPPQDRKSTRLNSSHWE